MLLGVAMVVGAAVSAARVVAGIDSIVVRVRPATPAEAGDPRYVERTVVAEPDAGPSVMAAVKRTLLTLVALAALAACGAGLVAWSVSARRAQRRRPPPPPAKAGEESHADQEP